MIENWEIRAFISFNISDLINFDTMMPGIWRSWYRADSMASGCEIPFSCHEKFLLGRASQCSTKKEKSPQLRGLSCYFMLFGASLYQTPNYSHSIIYRC